MIESNERCIAITRAYDGLDRLTSETTPQGSISYMSIGFSGYQVKAGINGLWQLSGDGNYLIQNPNH